MLDLLKACPLPEQPPVQASKDIAESWELGMDLQFLKDARERFLSGWSWSELEQKLNGFDNYIVELEECNLHFIHARSKRADAVPLLLLHGWPGSSVSVSRAYKKLNLMQGLCMISTRLLESWWILLKDRKRMFHHSKRI
jgi:pimeloyl-ACP methyl ester carboxylesterase